MAGPITWRNVDAPNLGDPSRTLAMAQGSFNSVFDSFNEQLKRLETTDANNWQIQKQLNTEDHLNWLSQFKTPEEAQAALASGELQSRLAQAGSQIDAKAVREAQQALVPELQRRAVLDQQFQDQKSDLSERDAVGNIRTLIAAGKFKDAGSAIQAAGVRAGTAATLQRELLEASRGDQRFKMELEDQRRQNMEFQLRQKEANARIQQMGEAKSNFKVMDWLRTRNAEIEAGEAAVNAQLQNSPFSGTRANDPKSRMRISETLDPNKGTGIFGGMARGLTKDNFFDVLVKDQSKAKGNQRWLSSDGSNLVFRKTVNGKEVIAEVPFTEDLMLHAIKSNDGAFFDPSYNEVVTTLRNLVSKPEMVEAAFNYVKAKDMQAALQQDRAGYAREASAMLEGQGSKKK